jgi:hypothetical protein
MTLAGSNHNDSVFNFINKTVFVRNTAGKMACQVPFKRFGLAYTMFAVAFNVADKLGNFFSLSFCLQPSIHKRN